MVVSLGDVLNYGATATITGCTVGTWNGTNKTVSIPANSTAVCSYTAAPTGRTATLNTATVNLNALTTTATANVGWTANVIRGSATLDDDQNPNLPPTITDRGTWTYDDSYTCSMSTTRRDFLRLAALTGGALSLGRVSPAFGIHVPSRRRAPLRILILGGTGFIGPYQVQYALDRGHTVTLFNRGRTNPQLFPTVEKLVGDRNGDLKSLEGRDWDVVIDNSATNPDWVELSARLLAPRVKRYVFVSTRSVYFDTSRVPMTVDAPVFSRENTPVEAGKPLPYGLAKALAEAAARAHFPGRALIVRPSLIIGPGDLTDRFTYWPVRIERGGEVLAPGDGTDSVQIIDARDLSEWMIRLVEQDVTGTYNALGPKQPRSFAELLRGKSERDRPEYFLSV